MDFISAFCAGSSSYKYKDNLFKIRRNNDDHNICDLTRGIFDIPNTVIAKKLWVYHLSMIDNFHKYIKIKNFVSSKTENYINICKTLGQITHLLFVSIG